MDPASSDRTRHSTRGCSASVPGRIYEIKFDGYRLLGKVDGHAPSHGCDEAVSVGRSQVGKLLGKHES